MKSLTVGHCSASLDDRTAPRGHPTTPPPATQAVICSSSMLRGFWTTPLRFEWVNTKGRLLLLHSRASLACPGGSSPGAPRRRTHPRPFTEAGQPEVARPAPHRRSGWWRCRPAAGSATRGGTPQRDAADSDEIALLGRDEDRGLLLTLRPPDVVRRVDDEVRVRPGDEVLEHDLSIARSNETWG